MTNDCLESKINDIIINPQDASFEDDFYKLNDDKIVKESHSAFEWWYFDCVDEKTKMKTVITYVARDKFMGDKPYIRVELDDGNKKKILVKEFDNNSLSAKLNEKTGNYEVSFDENNNFIISKNGEKNNYKLNLNIEKLKLKLNCESQHVGFKPTSDGKYFINEKGEYMGAVFPGPVINCSGDLTYDNNLTKIKGDGYHDHPFSLKTLSESSSDWYWASSKKNLTLILADVNPRKGFGNKFKLAAVGKQNQEVLEYITNFVLQANNIKKRCFKANYPKELIINSEEFSATLNWKESLVDLGSFYNRSQYEINWNYKGEKGNSSGWVETVNFNPKKIVQFAAKLQHKNYLKKTRKVEEEMML